MTENTKTLAEQVGALELEVRTLRARTATLQECITANMQREYDLRTAREKARKELTEARQERNEALYQRDAAERTVSVHEQVIKNLRADLDGTTREVARQKERVTLHAEAGAEFRRERDDAVARVGNYKLLLKNAETQRDQWKSEVAAKDRTITGLRAELAAIRAGKSVPFEHLTSGMRQRFHRDINPYGTVHSTTIKLPALTIAMTYTDEMLEDVDPKLVARELRDRIVELVEHRVEDYVVAIQREMKG